MVYNALLNIFKEVMVDEDIDFSKISKESRLQEDLSLDSIALLLLTIAIETEFGVEINPKDINDLHTVLDVCVYIEKHQK